MAGFTVNFAEALEETSIDFELNGGVLALGGITWQVINISTVRVDEYQLPASVERPLIPGGKPVAVFEPLYAVLALVVFAMFLSMSLVLAFLMGGAVAFWGWYSAQRKREKATVEWLARAKELTRKQKAWDLLDSGRPKRYALVFDANSGRVQALESLNSVGLFDVRDALLRHMRDRSRPERGRVKAWQGRETIDALYADFFRRAVEAA